MSLISFNRGGSLTAAESKIFNFETGGFFNRFRTCGYQDRSRLRRKSLPVALVLLLSPIAQAQRSFQITLHPTNNNAVAISWQAQSATPAGGEVLVPQFRVERSPDLKTWAPISQWMTAALGQTLTLIDSNTPSALYRVQALLDLQYAELSGANLAQGELAGSDFFGANLFGADLSEAILTGARLVAIDARFADFTRADLTGANLFWADAIGAKFDSGSLAGIDARFSTLEAASLFNVDLTGADFRSATLSSALLDFALLKQVKLDDTTRIDPKPKRVWQIVNHDQTGALLTNLDLSFASLLDVNFARARFTSSDLTASDLTGSDLRGADFTLANMRFVDFHKTKIDASTQIDSKSLFVWRILNQTNSSWDLHAANLSSVWLLGANLVNANLTNALLSTSVLEQANFGGANLTGANCFHCDFFGAIFTNANLTQAQFGSADFSNANLLNAITNGANFLGANFTNTIMPDGSVRNF